MHGFGTIEAASRFGCAFDELHNYLRPRRSMGEAVSLTERRQAFHGRLVALLALLQAAS
jgi:putative transposase